MGGKKIEFPAIDAHISKLKWKTAAKFRVKNIFKKAVLEAF